VSATAVQGLISRAAAPLLARQTAQQGVTVLSLMTVAAKVFGFVRETAIAHFFGVSGLVDAYRIAETATSLSAGPARQAFDVVGVPLLVEQRTRRGEAAERGLFGSLCTVALAFAAGLALVLFVLAGPLARLLAPNLAAGAGHSAAGLIRIMIPVAIANVLAGVAGSYYNARRQFIVPRLFDPVVNTVAVVILVLTARSWGVTGLAAGWSLGQMAGMTAAFLPLVYAGHRLAGSLRGPQVREFLVLSLPVLLVSIVQPLNVAVGRAFASLLPEGSIAMMGYADRLFVFPCYLLSASVAPVFYTKAAELAAAGDRQGLRDYTKRLLFRLGLVLVPATAVLAAISRPLVRLVYQHGAFTPEAAAATGSVLGFLSLGLAPFAAVLILTAAFRGQKDMKTPALAALCGVAVNVGLDFMLVRVMGLSGLALAASCGLSVTGLVLWLAFVRRRA
jgi:putative peptidoglycan lipid II flippase